MAKACKRPNKNIDKRELREAHRIKMEMKRIAREHNYARRSASWVRANVGVNHPDYGDSVEGHEKAKRERLKNSS